MDSLTGVFSVLCFAAPGVLARPVQEASDNKAAADVAKKVERAEVAPKLSAAEGEALRKFQDAVAQYAALHTRQVAKLGPPMPAGAKDAVAAQKALAAAIVASRDKAKPGDIFARDVQPLFRRLIGNQLKGPDTGAARKAVVEGNPEKDEDSAPVVVRVNAVYPSGAALSTVPASVLATLPQLPAPLQYRFVGRNLILLDSVAGLIVDFLPAGTPPLPAR